MNEPTWREVQEQTNRITLAVTSVLPRDTLPAAMIRAFARITAATVGAVAAPEGRAAIAVEVSEVWIEELKASLMCLAERDAQEGGGA
jgi:hypothetical protein